jgi:hypothetical protein
MTAVRTLTTLDAVVTVAQQIAASGQTLYCRYSAGPAADAKGGYRSRNHATGAVHCGLSVNNLTTADVAGGTERAWIVQQLADYGYMLHQGVRGTRCWLLTGTECGRGADGEPLVVDVQAVAFVAAAVLDEATAAAQAKADRAAGIRPLRSRQGVAFDRLPTEEREAAIAHQIDVLYGRS